MFFRLTCHLPLSEKKAIQLKIWHIIFNIYILYPLHIIDSRVFCCTWQNLIFKNLEICIRRSLIIRASIEKAFFTWNIKQPFYKKISLLKMLAGSSWKAPFIQYAVQGWNKRALFTENARWTWYGKSSVTLGLQLNISGGADTKRLFSLKMLDKVG